jgi:type IV secretion system protein VirD4
MNPMTSVLQTAAGAQPPVAGGAVLLAIAALAAAAIGMAAMDAISGAWEVALEAAPDALAKLPAWARRNCDLAGGVLAIMIAGAALLVHLAGWPTFGVTLLATVAVLELVALSGRPPHRLPRLVPDQLGVWPQWRRLDQRPYLGWSRGLVHRHRLAAGAPEDSVGIVGPPRRGKTMGMIVPQLLLWGGPAVSTSTKPDVLRATAGWRLALARQHGGGVYVYAPSSQGPVEGLRPVRWSPLDGCTEPRVARLRVDALVAAAKPGKGMQDPSHWEAGATRVLRPYFLAAACHPRHPGDFFLVRQWLARQEIEEPLAILTGLNSPAGFQWAAELAGVTHVPDGERGSFYSAAEIALAATSDPAVLDSCSATELDIERFAETRSTLYIVSSTEDQRSLAPLVSALIESIVTKIYDLHRDGRLRARLLLSLDELANIAPLPSLSEIVSQGAGQGVNVSWALQSLAQLRHCYGEEAAEAIWSATSAKLIFGGLADYQLLDRVQHLVGEHEVEVKSKTVGHGGGRVGHSTQVTKSKTWRPRLSVAELRSLPRGWALLLYHHMEPYCLRVPIAHHRSFFRRALLPWVAPDTVPAQPPVFELVAGALDGHQTETAEREAEA